MDKPFEEPLRDAKMEFLTDQKLMENLVNCFMEDLNEHSEKIEDPFESYTHQLRMRLHQDAPLFSKCFIEGYEVLFQQVKS